MKSKLLQLKEKIQELDEAIRKVCPETMELKFGCWVSYKKAPFRVVYEGVCFQKVDEKTLGVLHNGRIPDFITPKRDIIEIIGTPLGLPEVLRALTEIGGSRFFINSYKNRPKNKIDILREDWKYRLKEWDLTKSFQDQKPEVHNFLHSIICQK